MYESDVDRLGNRKIRHEHLKEVLNLLRLSGPISRVDIGNQINLSKPTVTRVVDDLIKKGLVRECGQVGTKVGRKKTLIELVPNSRVAIGVNLSRNNIYASLIDITMESRQNAVRSLKTIENNDEFYNLLISIIEELIEKSGLNKESILGIGVGVPGLVDHESGIVWKLDITNPLKDVRLKEKLEEYFRLPAMVDNNVNTLALGEYWFGYGWDKSVRELVYILSSEGVGGGIITQGELLRGRNNIAAELGEMIINMDDYATGGRVEDYCSTDVVEEVTGLDFEEACKMAMTGDGRCKEVMDKAIRALGIGLVNMVNILNPEIVVLSGRFVEGYPPFFSEVEKFARSRMVNNISAQVQILKRANRDAPYEIGAAALIFKPFFKD